MTAVPRSHRMTVEEAYRAKLVALGEGGPSPARPVEVGEAAALGGCGPSRARPVEVGEVAVLGGCEPSRARPVEVGEVAVPGESGPSPAGPVEIGDQGPGAAPDAGRGPGRAISTEQPDRSAADVGGSDAHASPPAEAVRSVITGSGRSAALDAAQGSVRPIMGRGGESSHRSGRPSGSASAPGGGPSAPGPPVSMIDVSGPSAAPGPAVRPEPPITPLGPAAGTRPPARPRIEQEPAILGLSRHTRSRIGSRLFNLFFVFVFALIVVQMIVALLTP